MRHAQSGIFGLGALISLAVYAGLAIAALGAIYAFDRSRQAIGEQKAEARLQPIIQACNVDRDTAVAANKTLQADVDKLFIEREVQNKAVELQAAETARIRAYRAAQKPIDDAKLAQIAADKFNLIVALGKPDGGISCEQMDTMLLDVAKQRTRDYGPASAVAPVAPGALKIVDAPVPERPKAVNPLRAK